MSIYIIIWTVIDFCAVNQKPYLCGNQCNTVLFFPRYCKPQSFSCHCLTATMWTVNVVIINYRVPWIDLLSDRKSKGCSLITATCSAICFVWILHTCNNSFATNYSYNTHSAKHLFILQIFVLSSHKYDIKIEAGGKIILFIKIE